jgi:hypothetical protein
VLLSFPYSSLSKTQTVSYVWWHTPVIPATWEAEASLNYIRDMLTQNKEGWGAGGDGGRLEVWLKW